MKVAIDAGHGMSNRRKHFYDPGATHVEDGFEYQEADIALLYAQQLKDTLLACGIESFLTRRSEKDHAPYRERVRNARASKCDLLISFHLNDFEDDSANGLEVLYNTKKDLELAKKLQTKLSRIAGMRSRGTKHRPELAVLKFTGPSVLIELGFIGNDKNREVLINPQKREAICQGIAEVISTG